MLKGFYRPTEFEVAGIVWIVQTRRMIDFKLKGVTRGTEATPKHLPKERIIMLFSFRTTDAESHYLISERQCVAVVRCLPEVRWLVMGNKHPILIYSDHDALKSIMSKGQTEQGRISSSEEWSEGSQK